MVETFLTARSVRDIALDRLADAIRDMQAGVPTADPYEFTVDLVQRVPFSRGEDGARLNVRSKELAVAVLEGTNIIVPNQAGLGNITPQLTVVTEWHSTSLADRGSDPDEIQRCNNRVLTNLYRIVRANRTLNGIIMDMKAQSDDLFVDDYADFVVGGQITWLMEFKHDGLDPRRILPGGSFLPDA